MRSRTLAGLLLAAGLGACAGGCASPQRVAAGAGSVAGAGLDAGRVPFGPDLRAAELRTLLETIGESYSHLDDKRSQWGLDLAQLEARYEPAARLADTWDKYEIVMVRLAGEFHDAHLAWRRTRAPSESRRRVVRLGLSTRFVGDALYVDAVWPGSGAEAAGIKLGDRIIAWNGSDVETHFKEHAALRSWSRIEDERHDFADEWPAWRVDGAAEPRAREVVLRSDGGKRDADAGADAALTTTTLRVPPETRPRGKRSEPVTLEQRGGATVLSLRSLRALMLPSDVDALVRRIYAEPRGLVVDLRDNAGGYEHLARALASRLTTRRLVGASVRVRLTPRARAEHGEWRTLAEDPARPGWSTPVPVAAEPLAKVDYPARVALLLGPGCRSACETLTLLLRQLGARSFGETTGGSSGAPVTYVMPWSRATLTVPAWSMVDAAGRALEGAGVTPDEPLAPTREDLIAARDVVMERALAWVAEK